MEEKQGTTEPLLYDVQSPRRLGRGGPKTRSKRADRGPKTRSKGADRPDDRAVNVSHGVCPSEKGSEPRASSQSPLHTPAADGEDHGGRDEVAETSGSAAWAGSSSKEALQEDP